LLGLLELRCCRLSLGGCTIPRIHHPKPSLNKAMWKLTLFSARSPSNINAPNDHLDSRGGCWERCAVGLCRSVSGASATTLLLSRCLYVVQQQCRCRAGGHRRDFRLETESSQTPSRKRTGHVYHLPHAKVAS